VLDDIDALLAEDVDPTEGPGVDPPTGEDDREPLL
jgi:hypothetical protein